MWNDFRQLVLVKRIVYASPLTQCACLRCYRKIGQELVGVEQVVVPESPVALEIIKFIPRYEHGTTLDIQPLPLGQWVD